MVVTGSGDSVTYNDPSTPVSTYTPDGYLRVVSEGGANILLEKGEVLEAHSMEQFANNGQWTDLIVLAEKEKEKNLPWPTPFFYAGEGYSAMCMAPEAIQNLSAFVDSAKAKQEYLQVVGRAKAQLSVLQSNGILPGEQCGK